MEIYHPQCEGMFISTVHGLRTQYSNKTKAVQMRTAVCMLTESDRSRFMYFFLCCKQDEAQTLSKASLCDIMLQARAVENSWKHCFIPRFKNSAIIIALACQSVWI